MELFSRKMQGQHLNHSSGFGCLQTNGLKTF